MEQNLKSDVAMEEKISGGGKGNLIAVLIALLILIVVAVIYWDRQSQRRFDLAENRMEIVEELGPAAGRQFGSAFGQPVAFSRQVSYKNIVARVAPSVVSINVGSSFINQNGAPPVARPAAQGPGAGMAGPNAWPRAGQAGGWPVPNYTLCPNCRTSIPCRGFGPGCRINCPGCGMAVMTPGAAAAQPFGYQAQPPMQNQAIGQPQPASAQYVWGGRMGGYGLGPAGYMVCPNCGTTVAHQRGVPAYTVGCPNCGTQMARAGAPGPYPIAPQAGAQQLAAAGTPRQFPALGKGGSGIIVSSSGYVLTNHHVIHGARSIRVTLSAGQVTKTYPAEIIDEAPNLDFAILKIVTSGNEQFIAAPVGNSDMVSVGDEVLAIGSPFGLQQTVTFGIISNTNRTLTVGNKTFNNFIQTDAPINPGSSGGPLINIRGELIGINTAIYSPTQAFSGIGFASPINPATAAFPEFIENRGNVARALMEGVPNWAGSLPAGQIPIKKGLGQYPWSPPGGALRQAANTTNVAGLRGRRLFPRCPRVDGLWQGAGTQNQPIQRGSGAYPWCPPNGPVRQVANVQNQPWLGIRVRTADKQTCSGLGMPMGWGVIVTEVLDNSPSVAAGLQRGDVIFRVDGRCVRDGAMLEAMLSNKRTGERMKLTVFRAGRKINLTATLAARPVDFQSGAAVAWGEGLGFAEPIIAQAVAAGTQPFIPFDPENVQPPGLRGVLQGSEVGAGEIEALGMGVEQLVPELALAFGIPEGMKGLVITESANQAADAGLLAGDVIKAVNNRRVRTIVDFIKVMNKADLSKGVSFHVYRQGQRFSVTIKA